MRTADVLTVAVFACLAGCASQKPPSQVGADGPTLRIEQVNKAALADYLYCVDADCPERTIKTIRIEEADYTPPSSNMNPDLSYTKKDLFKVKKHVVKKHKKGGKKAKKPAYKYVCVKQPEKKK